MPQKSSSEISLALVTYNQSILLKQFLQNYQNAIPRNIDLIIIDDGSTDATPEILSFLTQDSHIHVHQLPHGSIAKARNHALHNSPTPWLAFSDTDCLLDHHYFEMLPSLPIRFSDAIAIEGAVYPPIMPKAPFTHSLTNPKGGTFATANMVFHVPSIIALGGFDEQFGNFREDSDLALTIIEQNGPIPFCPELAIVHPHLPRKFGRSLRRAYATQYQIIYSEKHLFEKHPFTYSRIRHYPDAHRTLKAWCWKYTFPFCKEAIRYLFKTQGLTPSQKLKGLALGSAEIIVALWEQMCIATICMLQWNEIKRLKSK